MKRPQFYFRRPLIAIGIASIILLALLVSSIVSAGATPLSDRSSDIQPAVQQVTPDGASPPASPSPAPPASPTASPAPPMLTAAQFQDAMRQLWVDHNIWHWAVIASIFADLPNLDAAQARQIQNQVDIGNGIKPFYGEEAGNQVADLLKEHVNLLNKVAVDMKNADTAALENDKAAAYANGEDIAAFLAAANPENWPLDAAQGLLRGHIDSILLIAQARLDATNAGAEGDWEAEIAAFDEAMKMGLMLADVLSQGIIAQFPDKFAEQEPSAATPGATMAPPASP